MNGNQLPYTYDDDQPWIALCIPKTEREMKARIKNLGVEVGLGCVYHVEPLARYRYQPPGNKEWQQIGVAKGIMGALELTYGDMQARYAGLFKSTKHKSNGHIDRKTRFRVMRRDGFKCQLCGRTADDGVTLEVDHIYPKAHGGTNDLDNLWTLCFDCNRSKRDTILEGTE